MKKNRFLSLFVVLLAVLTIVSCGSKGPKSSEGLSDDGKAELIENLNYRKACEIKDFDIAYQIVDKLKEATSWLKIQYDDYKGRGSSYTSEYRSKYEEAKKKSDEAERYVVLQEAMLVLESEGSNGLMRIVGIAKEHKVEGWFYSEMADLAKKIGDPELEEKFNNMKPMSGSDDLNEGIIPSQKIISGPLSGYYEVVDKKYKENDNIKYNSHTIYVELKKTKKGLPEKIDYRSNLHIGIEYLDENDNVVGKEVHFVNQQKQMISCNLGETASVSFTRYGDNSVKKFRIYSYK
jgi:hypothetical protein